MWRYTGRDRPPFATLPGPGQESVWDYPRPPRLERVTARLRVMFNDEAVADTTEAFRVLETSHPPVYYIAPEHVAMQFLSKMPGRSWCEFKGHAGYWSLEVRGRRAENVAWSYATPTPAFAAIAGHLAFYASKVDECWVGDELVQAQPGDFYGGWITADIQGPFKGPPGTAGW